MNKKSLTDADIRTKFISSAIETAGWHKVTQMREENVSLIRKFLVSLPPLLGQRRIVAKVDQLMDLVDGLETQLAAFRATAKNLL